MPIYFMKKSATVKTDARAGDRDIKYFKRTTEEEEEEPSEDGIHHYFLKKSATVDADARGKY